MRIQFLPHVIFNKIICKSCACKFDVKKIYHFTLTALISGFVDACVGKFGENIYITGHNLEGEGSVVAGVEDDEGKERTGDFFGPVSGFRFVCLDSSPSFY